MANQLRRSGTRLQRHGTLWFQQTRAAAETFVGECSSATLTFARDITAASGKLASTVARSTEGFGKAVQKETVDWRALVLQLPEVYAAALKEWFDHVEHQALTARESLKPQVVETSVLESAHSLLERAQNRVEERLRQATEPAKPMRPAAVRTAKKPKAPRTAEEREVAPLRNYDQLSARDLISRVQRLSPPQATAVLDYERARKRRATVIRAAEQRLAAAS
jgi:hypothetical protein